MRAATSSWASRGSAGGRVGVVAKQPSVLAGVLDIDASVKAARFVRFCDCFNIPLVDVRRRARASCRASAQEHGGIIRHGAKLLYAYCRGDGAEADRHHAQGLRRRVRRHVEQAHPRRRQLRLADAPRSRSWVPRARSTSSTATRSRRPRIRTRRAPQLVARVREQFANPYEAAARGYIDEVIVPHETRPKLIAALKLLATKRDTNPPRKHGNIPL